MKGVFDPTATTWTTIGLGAWMEAENLLDRINNAEDIAALQRALQIPCYQVGTANLHGSIGTANVDQLDVTMNNVTFLASSTGCTPRIWATPRSTVAAPTTGVSGYYRGSPVDRQATLNLQSGTDVTALGAKFTIPSNNWNTSANQWGATVTDGTGTVNGAAITFRGGAAGQIISTPMSSTPGTFVGTGAGIVNP